MKKKLICLTIALLMLLGAILGGCSVKFVNVDFSVDGEIVQQNQCIAVMDKLEVSVPAVEMPVGLTITGWGLAAEYADYATACTLNGSYIQIDLSKANSDKFVFEAIVEEVENSDGNGENNGDNGSGDNSGDGNEDNTPDDNLPEEDIASIYNGIADQTVKKYIAGNSDNAYKAIILDEITSVERASQLQEIYRQILKAAIVFAENKTTAPKVAVEVAKDAWGRPITEDYGEFLTLDVSKYGLNINEACLVFGAFRKDTPYFYWLSRLFTYSMQTTGKLKSMTLYCDLEYRAAATRQNIQNMLASDIAAYDVALQAVTSREQKAKVFHDTVIKQIDYKYDNGEPSMANGAHNIVGVLDRTGVVCEGYAKMFQYLCNYYGVPNRYVIGYAGEAHAWNLFMADNGNYYWIDLTWDDAPETASGVEYTYFGMGDLSFKTNHSPYGYGNYAKYGSNSISQNWTTKGYSTYYIDWQQNLPTNISKLSLI